MSFVFMNLLVFFAMASTLKCVFVCVGSEWHGVEILKAQSYDFQRSSLKKVLQNIKNTINKQTQQSKSNKNKQTSREDHTSLPPS